MRRSKIQRATCPTCHQRKRLSLRTCPSCRACDDCGCRCADLILFPTRKRRDQRRAA